MDIKNQLIFSHILLVIDLKKSNFFMLLAKMGIISESSAMSLC
jgi:hypothetical protein